MERPVGNDQTVNADPDARNTERLKLVSTHPRYQQNARASPSRVPGSQKPRKSHRAPKFSRDVIKMKTVVEDVEDEAYLRDRGYAWIIVFGTFLNELFAVRCDGILFLQFEDHFQESAQLTAWPGAISFTLQCFSAPLTAWFCSRFSVRTGVILGTLFNITGLVITAFAPNIYLLFLSYSIFMGLGRGFTIGPGIYIINMYFDKYRGMAMGLATAGMGISTIAFVPLINTLFMKLGYQKAFLVLTATSFSGFIVAALFRPFSVHKEMVRKRRLNAALAQDSRTEKSPEHVFYNERGSVNHDYTAGVIQEDADSSINYTDSSVACGSDVMNGIAYSGTSHAVPDIVPNRTDTRVKADGVKTVGEKRKKNWFRACIDVVFPVEGGNNSNQDGRAPLFHWNLFRDFPFLLLCTSMTFYSLAQKTIYTFLPAMGEEQGLSEFKASLLISIAGAGDTVGRIAGGLLLDLPAMRPFKQIIYTCVLFSTAGVAAAVPFSYKFALLCAISASFGLLSGAAGCQRATILADMLGRETVNSALGIMTSFRGIGAFVGPPLSGALKDISGEFKPAFFVSSGNMAGAGAFVVTSILLIAWRKHRQVTGTGNQGYQNMGDETSATEDSDASLWTTNEERLSARARFELTNSLLSSIDV